MNWDRIEGNWKQLKGKIQQQWGKLTDDHLDVIAGKREHLSGKIQEMYGITPWGQVRQAAITGWRTKNVFLWMSNLGYDGVQLDVGYRLDLPMDERVIIKSKSVE